MLSLTLQYNGTDGELLGDVEQLQLRDVLAKEASTLQITLRNTGGRYTGAWAAVRGDVIGFSLGSAKPRSYAIDKVTVQASPATVVWSASARPLTTKRPKKGGSGAAPPPPGAAELSTKSSWAPVHDLTLSALLKRVADEAGMRAVYAYGKDPALGTVSRYRESAWRLLTRQARRFGCEVNASADILTLTGPRRAKEAIDKGEQIAIVLEDKDIAQISSAQAITPGKVRAVTVDADKGKITLSDAEGEDGFAVLLDEPAGDPAAVLEYLRAEATEIRLSLRPREVVAGAVIEYQNVRYEVRLVEYTRTGAAETMTLTCRGI